MTPHTAAGRHRVSQTLLEPGGSAAPPQCSSKASDRPRSDRDSGAGAEAAGQAPREEGPAEEAATAASELFCALCTKQPAMLLDLLRTYGLVSALCQAVALRLGRDPCCFGPMATAAEVQSHGDILHVPGTRPCSSRARLSKQRLEDRDAPPRCTDCTDAAGQREHVSPLCFADTEPCAQAERPAQKALHRNAPGLARVLGAPEPSFVAALQGPPPGSQALLLQMLYTLTGRSLLCAMVLAASGNVPAWAPQQPVRLWGLPSQPCS